MAHIKNVLKMILSASMLGTSASAAEDFEKRVMEAILDNPEIILMALERLESAQEADRVGGVASRIEEESNQLFGEDGQYDLVEFFDYRCGYCSESAKVISSLDDTDADRIRIVELPILGLTSRELAKISLAVRKLYGPAKYAEFHSAVFERNGRIHNSATAIRLAQELSLDGEAIKIAASHEDIEEELLRNRRLAGRLGITGTPAFVSRKTIHEGLLDAKVIMSFLDNAEESTR